MLSIIVPIYNEEKLIEKSLPLIFDLELSKEVIVVNDGSIDSSLKILIELKNKYDFKIINLENNQGKGSAIRQALNYVKGDYFTICDADMEYDPRELARLYKHIIELREEKVVVYGSRFLKNKPFSFHYFVNTFLTLVFNLLFRVRLTDMETCFKLIPARAINKINLTAKRFEIEPQITAQLIKNGYRIKELPISYNRRNYEEGKKIKPRDGIIAVWTIIKEKIGK